MGTLPHLCAQNVGRLAERELCRAHCAAPFRPPFSRYTAPPNKLRSMQHSL